MRLTREQKTEMLIKQVNEIGVVSIAFMQMSVKWQGVQIELANYSHVFWKIENGQESEFESKLRFIERRSK